MLTNPIMQAPNSVLSDIPMPPISNAAGVAGLRVILEDGSNLSFPHRSSSCSTQKFKSLTRSHYIIDRFSIWRGSCPHHQGHRERQRSVDWRSTTGGD